MTELTNILIIEDDAGIRDMLSQYLQNEGYNITTAADGKTGLQLGQLESNDLCIVDVMLPEVNGFDVVKAIRQKRTVPIIMLTARTEEIDRILGLEIGADDYMTKPFSARELVARIRAIERRVSTFSTTQENDQHEWTCGALTLNSKSHFVTLSNEAINLTGTEFSLLHQLIQQPGAILDKNTLSQAALGRRVSAYDRSIDMHISNLRKKIGASPEIKTVRGNGYILVDPNA